MSAEPSLKDKVVFINGAGRGPGPLLVQTFAGQGAIVAACEASPVLLDPLVDRVRQQGGQIKPYVGEVSRGMPARSLVDEVLADWDRVDVLVNNPRSMPNSPVQRMDEWDWHHTLEVNLSGPFLLTQLISPLMAEQGGGTILNLVAADEPALTRPGQAAYAASQSGLLALTRTAARELIAYNIHTFALCLDEAALQMSMLSIPDPSGQPRENGMLERSVTLGETISGLVLFLCSPSAAHLSGQAFRIDATQEPGLRPESQQE